VFAVPQVKHDPLLKIITLSAVLHKEHLPAPLDIIQIVEFMQEQPPFPSLSPVEKGEDEDVGQARQVEFNIYDIFILQTQFPPVALVTQKNCGAHRHELFLVNPNPPRVEGQLKHVPLIRMLVFRLQPEVLVGKTQFPPLVLPTHDEGGIHPHYTVVLANPFEFDMDPHNTQFPLTSIEFIGLQTHLLFKAL
jgi:hypothetical protein